MRPISQAIVVACLGLVPGPALAWDWSLSSTMSQTFELNDNQFMRNMLAGGTLGSYTDVTANAVALTPTSKLTIDGDVGYTQILGTGDRGHRTNRIRSGRDHCPLRDLGQKPGRHGFSGWKLSPVKHA